MSVTLRKRKNKDGTTSIVLDIYHNGKRYYEFLKHLQLHKGTDAPTKISNREKLHEAKKIATNKAIELQANENDVIPDFKKKTIFLDFFDDYLNNYTKKDKRVIAATKNQFCSFLPTIKQNTSILAKELNEELVFDFKCYLENELNGESPSTYFKRFKKVLKHGYKKGIFKKYIGEDVTIKEDKNNTIKKEILTFEELRQLMQIEVGSTDVKRAFLFSCLTGLRFCDVKALQYQHINKGALKIVQQKTGVEVTTNLNKDALMLIESGNPQDFVFNLPSSTACNKALKLWLKKAAIPKKITWHCARHTFATNLIFYGANELTTSKLLGHTNTKFTARYAKIADSMKQDAVNNLPALNM